MNVREVGAYIRDQRLSARLSLKSMSGLAGVSIPYLSQVERGLRKPSADILQAIAKGLRISASTLYVRAGILEDSTVPDVASAIMGDPAITERQKQALLQIYEAFRDEAARDPGPTVRQASSALPVPPDDAPAQAHRRPGSTVRRPSRSPATGGTRATGTRGGGAKPRAATSPHPAPLRPSVPTKRKEV